MITALVGLLVVASPNVKEADALFVKARALMKEGNAARACPMLEESHALDPALGTLLNLGDCYETVGRLTQAYLRFNEAAAWATRTHEKSRADIARARSAALKPRLSWLSLSQVMPEPGVVATVNGVSVPLGKGARLVPVDEGQVVVTVTAADRTPWSTRLNVGPRQTLACAIPVLSDLKRPAFDPL